MNTRMSLHNKKNIACGWEHTLALGERGLYVFACGNGRYGQLGAGTRAHQRTLAPVAGLEEQHDVVMVAAGNCHSVAVTSAGALLLWGYNYFGQLGQGDKEDRLVPVTLCLLQFGGDLVAMVACGGDHTLVVTRVGRLFAFGEGSNGQLGLGDRNDRIVPVEVGPGRLGGAIITYAAAGRSHSGVVTSGGGVWTWGCGYEGRLGHNDEHEQLEPRELQEQFGGACALSLAAGATHTMVVTTCGAVWAFGRGADGQLGLGDVDDRYAPVRVGGEEAFGQSKVHTVACGNTHTVAVTDAGALWSWGCGDEGRLGHNDEDDRLVPTRVGRERFGGAKITTADCGGALSAAVSEDGALFTWGAEEWIGAPAGLGHNDRGTSSCPPLWRPTTCSASASAAGLHSSPSWRWPLPWARTRDLGVARWQAVRALRVAKSCSGKWTANQRRTKRASGRLLLRSRASRALSR
tara:strand:+ start:2258 stop:3643 length:1386 start_codon:yes stop_codon:yes gene_type:complete